MASRGKTATLAQMYVADFETCDAWEGGKGEIPEQRVWLAGMLNLETKEFRHYSSIAAFMSAALERGNNLNREFAFHNLKFDGSYIVPWLFNNGYTVSEGKPEKGEFSCLIADRNNWYNITVQVTCKQKITFWDSLKLFPMPLEYLHTIYDTPTHKQHEEAEFYTKIRLPGHTPTSQELEYLYKDLKVLEETLNEHIKLYGLRFKKTQASQSFHNFTKCFPLWKKRFPPLHDSTDKLIRPAYWGGISHVATQYQGKNCWGVSVYDINSSYPFQLATKKLPYGPMLYKYHNSPPDMSKFWVAEVICRFTLKENCLPCIPKKAIIEPMTFGAYDKWVGDSDGVVKIIISCIDYMTIQGSYKFDVVRWGWVCHWAWKQHKEVAEFILQNNSIKVTCREQAREEENPEKRRQLLIQANRAKIDSNSFYGKFGESIEKVGKIPTLSNGEVVYTMERKEIQSKHARKYLPVAIAVTAWGRKQLVELANTLGKDFIYCDTDSVHFFNDGMDKLSRVEVHNTKLGAWSNDGNFYWGRYLRPKCYMEGNPGMSEYEATVAGLPADKGTGYGSKIRSCCNYDNFHIGLVIPGGNGKLRSIRTPTGIKLVPVDFEIKENDTLANGRW